MLVDGGRRAHYGDFYTADRSDEPVAVVIGNCQAESLRVLLSTSETFPVRAVRVPPVHELTGDDLPFLRSLLANAVMLATQPVRDDYRGLPLGTRQLTGLLPPSAQVVRWPVIRYHGLHPFNAIVRHPLDRSLDPPVVPYHDLRTLTAAAGLDWRPDLGPRRLRAVAADAVADLARREEAAGVDVCVSDLLLPAGARAAHTLNHPGNDVLLGLAHRVQGAFGHTPDARDPGRTLLDSVHAPLIPEVVDALDLDAAPRPHWVVAHREVDDERVRAAQLAWYAEHPAWVAAGLDRLAHRLALLAAPG
ncbi:WcbI family polysaccharide biosynthesis putative acetyltransferase [Actinokineospora sp. G85]|uniref:WcbI family polysaccharide biosynthesis putative acetyltransferase n=1 Tax=Actinokineospora sp. G85 TaxID=3406626 RepID=UPI003C74BDB8